MTAAETCQRDGCAHAGKWAPKLCVPARDWAIDLHRPLALVMGLRLCRDHVNAMDPQEILGPDLRRIIEGLAKGKQPPDFDRAFITAIRTTSAEFLRLSAPPAATGKA